MSSGWVGTVSSSPSQRNRPLSIASRRTSGAFSGSHLAARRKTPDWPVYRWRVPGRAVFTLLTLRASSEL